MQSQCKRVGAELAHIDDAKQNAVAISLVGKSRAFIGLTDAIKEGHFKWPDGTKPSYTNWAPGEPNNRKNDISGDEDCVVINWHGDKWDDVPCKSNKWSEGFVCSARVNPALKGLQYMARAVHICKHGLSLRFVCRLGFNISLVFISYASNRIGEALWR